MGHIGASPDDLAHGGVLQGFNDAIIQDAPDQWPVSDSKLQQRLHPHRERLGRRSPTQIKARRDRVFTRGSRSGFFPGPIRTCAWPAMECSWAFDNAARRVWTVPIDQGPI